MCACAVNMMQSQPAPHTHTRDASSFCKCESKNCTLHEMAQDLEPTDLRALQIINTLSSRLFHGSGICAVSRAESAHRPSG